MQTIIAVTELKRYALTNAFSLMLLLHKDYGHLELPAVVVTFSFVIRRMISRVAVNSVAVL